MVDPEASRKIPPTSFDFPDWDRAEPIDCYKYRRQLAVDLHYARMDSRLSKTGADGLPLYKVSQFGRIVRTKSVNASRRRKVLERDGYACIWCGSDRLLEVDHVVRYADGGSNDPDNLRTLCHECHASRGRRN